MRDVAELAGVSIMTVSRVINGNAHVAEATQKRVFDAVAELDYRPNEVARSLRDQRTRQIGVIVPNIHDPFFAICAQAVSMVARSHDYSVNMAMSDEDPDVEYSEAILMLRRNIEGIIVIPCGSKTSRLSGAEFQGMPIVAVDRPLPTRKFDSVLVQNTLGSQLAVRHLLDHGHRNISFLGLSDKLYTIRKRCEGYCQAMTAAGLPTHIHYGSTTAEEMRDLLRIMMKKRPAPTAIFCSNNLQSRHALHALSELRIAVPQRVAVVGFDDFETADLLKPPLTVVRQPNLDLGRVGADLLFSRLSATAPLAPRHMILPVELIVRGSCGGRHTPPAAPPAL